jgi:tetratricopeptide (TPR) repeat protein
LSNYLGTQEIFLSKTIKSTSGGTLMKALSRLFILLVLLGSLTSCGEKMTEQQMRAMALDYENKEQWEKAIETYEKILKTYKDSPKADETLYKLGSLYVNHKQDFEKSIAIYKQLIEKYPSSQYAVKSAFMIGYWYANNIQDLDKAQQAYESFLENYPDHELAASVEWELNHLGQDISSIELDLQADSLAN